MTDNTKAVEKLAAMVTINTALPYGVDRKYFLAAARAILAAFQADPLEFVKPKPLIFDYVGEDRETGAKTWTANASELYYAVVERIGISGGLYFDLYLGEGILGTYTGSDVAFKKGNDDLCKRVKELF